MISATSIQDNSVSFDKHAKSQAKTDQDLENVELGSVEKADGLKQDEVKERRKLLFRVFRGCSSLAIIGGLVWLGLWLV
jgi:hypothetical protein